MTPELIVLVLAALLQVIQILGSGILTAQAGLSQWNVGPRDTTPAMPPVLGRMARVVNNHTEGLILFAIAALVTALTGQSTALTATLAWLYLAARVLYIPAYAFGWSPWRSAIWMVGFVSTIVMLLATLF
ncbi:inner membrane protein [Ketogulonicigenium robustum]|uniref:Inner membrane protein n=1 Tax=Ketogulonicigenium robustum TaxID=92947 RepID=A0A1W6NW73_9RHOB|nr:MAPEG family protein [Ketogulonicigenium robustum]ARO13486.1 inner membrane protein [Ketogulonicigenium robustum]